MKRLYDLSKVLFGILLGLVLALLWQLFGALSMFYTLLRNGLLTGGN